MHRFIKPSLIVALLVALIDSGCSPAPTSGSTLATIQPLTITRSIDLADHTGETFFELMIQPGGIKAQLDADQENAFVVADSSTALAARERFSDKVNRKVTRPFGSRGVQGFKELVDDLAGESHTTVSIKAALSARGLTPWSIADFLTMASGAGAIVHIDADNYYYNVSYESDEVKSGRSFGAGPMHKADDASYPFYLDELAKHLDHSGDPLAVYEALLQILTANDVGGVDDLDDYGQTLLTDFVTIYTAELYRHVIAGLGGRAPWENDLAESTFVSLWSQTVGRVQKDGELVPGDARDWNGVGTRGSGVGITRKDRRSLQTKICNAVRELRPGLVEAFEVHVDRPRADCYRSITEFLNAFETQADVRAVAAPLTETVVAFLAYTRDHADDILDRIEH